MNTIVVEQDPICFANMMKSGEFGIVLVGDGYIGASVMSTQTGLICLNDGTRVNAPGSVSVRIYKEMKITRELH